MAHNMNHLSPWDMTGLGMGFGLYRPRRPSYTYATQQQRQRSESYRYAVRKSASEIDEPADFIEGIIQMKNRKQSYIRATRSGDPCELEPSFIAESPTRSIIEPIPERPERKKSDGIIRANNLKIPRTPTHQNHNNHASERTVNTLPRRNGTNKERTNTLSHAISENHLVELKKAVARKLPPNSSPRGTDSPTSKRVRKKSMVLNVKEYTDETQDDAVFMAEQLDQNKTIQTPSTPNSMDMSIIPVKLRRFRFKKNLTLLCISFILIYSAFRAIQNLQSSINSDNNLGIIAMACVHGTMFLTCLWAPVIINNITAKWTLVVGMLSFILWFSANFYPRFYTLIPFGIIAGVGQGILWTAESSYMLKLAFDSSRATHNKIENEVFRFHGIFLACFQTTHIWGNLISSLVLHSANKFAAIPPDDDDSNRIVASCGVLYTCPSKSIQDDIVKENPSTLWKLMIAYVALGLIAFLLVMMCLDKIGARVSPEKTGYEIVIQHISMMVTHKTFRLLVPLLTFNGLQQAFVFSDFNQAYVKCVLGEEYIGYSMIILGLANVISSIFVAVCANLIRREVVFCVGAIVHMALMIGILIWIPNKSLLVFFILAATWGVCDAVWQTQCNTLLCITCPEDTDIAFANYRMLQSLGLTIGFLSGTFICVSFKLYILVILLVVSIMFYVLAEYRVRQVDVDIFEGQVEVN